MAAGDLQVVIHDAVPRGSAFLAGQCPDCKGSGKRGGSLCSTCSSHGFVAVRVELGQERSG